MKEEYIDIDSYPFSGNQSYFQYCFQRLLPKYNTWVAQVAAHKGDKSNCAKKFLFTILPYLVTTVIQNGIYFIEEFPQHPFSQLLRSIHEYTRFAVFQRAKQLETVERYQQEKVNQLDSLGENVCTVIGSLQREVAESTAQLNHHREIFQQQVITMQEKMINLQMSFIRQNETLHRMSIIQEELTNTLSRINTRQEEMSKMLEHLYNKNINSNTNAALVGNNPVIQNENNNTINVNVVIPGVNENNNLVVNNNIINDNNMEEDINQDNQILIQNQRNRRPQVNGVLGLHGTPQVPPMRLTFPESWLQVLEEWNLLHLSSFIGYGKRSHFTKSQNSRYSKRLRAINQMEKLALARGQSFQDTAEQLDGDRNFRLQQGVANRNGRVRFSMTDHLEELERNDPTIRRRTNR